VKCGFGETAVKPYSLGHPRQVSEEPHVGGLVEIPPTVKASHGNRLANSNTPPKPLGESVGLIAFQEGAQALPAYAGFGSLENTESHAAKAFRKTRAFFRPLSLKKAA